jgi:restriction system protein
VLLRTNLGDEIRHTRSVQWLRADVLRSDFQQDVRSTLTVRLTVYRIGRPNAEPRIQAVLNKQTDPGPGEIEDGVVEGADASEAQASDVEQTAREQLLDYIQSKFPKHKLADLVDAVLQAEDYFTKVSPPGPDGGVDILAATGPMGFGSPKLCVQVKSSKDRAEVKLRRELKGILKEFGAEQGLLVCWGGFTAPTQQEARQNFFNIRLWDQEDLLEAVLKNYERFPADLQAELPLKQVWMLVMEEEA